MTAGIDARREVTLDRLRGQINRWLYAGGTREDRLRDPDRVVATLDLRSGMVVGDLGPGAAPPTRVGS